MICAFQALCIVSLVVVYLDLNLNSNSMFKLKSNCLFFSLFFPLGPAQAAISLLSLSSFSSLAARPAASLFSLLSFPHGPYGRGPPSPPFLFFLLCVAHSPVPTQPPARGLFPRPGPTCLHPRSFPALSLWREGPACRVPLPRAAPDSGSSPARPRADLAASASGPHAQAPPRPPIRAAPNPRVLSPSRSRPAP
jgi:hypothetical protein